MKVKVTEVIKNYDGTDLKMDDKPLTWRGAINISLNNFQDHERPNAETKVRCFQLTMLCQTNDEPDLSITDKAFILDRIALIMNSPLIYGRALEFFEKE